MTALHYAQVVNESAAGYAPTEQLAAHWTDGKVARMWRLGPRIISMQLNKRHGGGIWKAKERLPLSEPMKQLDALEASGVEHPSSWADCYHQLAPNVSRVKHTFNGMLNWWSGGPWSEALRTGNHGGCWYRYDLVSAYRWAATLGLPDTRTYRATRNTHRNGRWKDGIWLATINGDRSKLPTCFRTDATVVVTTEDVATYGLNVTVDRGITWESQTNADYVEKTLAKLPYPKEAGRAYWGRWIARDPLIVQTPAREWPMHNIFANFVWGWLIVHRVRARVWQASKHAAHVYVDEVLVPHTMATDSGLGAWHLKEQYENGITVRRTGWYGPRLGKSTMRTGIQ